MEPPPPVDPPADPASPGSPASPPVPLNFTGYCLNCSYNLRGLSEARCPECGRRFRPSAPSTYSLQPRSRSAALKQLAEAARGKGRSHLPWTVSERVLWLEGRVRHLSAQNAELEWTVRALVDVLVARGVIGLDELARLMRAGVTSPVPFEDEPDAPPDPPPELADAAPLADEVPASDEMPLSDEPDLEAAALRELQSAARQRQQELGGATQP